MRARAALIALGLALGLASIAAVGRAQEPAGDAVAAMVGTWEFANADRDRVCAVTFRADPGPAGMRVEFDRQCATLYPFVAEIAGWRIAENDFLRLLNAQGATVLEFSEVEGGVYEAPRPGEGILFIQNAGAAGPAPRTAAEVAGEYGVMRGGKPVCTLALADAPVGAELALRVLQPCDAVVTRFAPVAWQVERGELVLRGAKGQIWRFEEEGENAWRRVPQAADAVTLVRR